MQELQSHREGFEPTTSAEDGMFCRVTGQVS